MPVSAEPRVALYFDFDNIVISRYDQLHGDPGSRRVSAYRKDTSTSKAPAAGSETAKKLAEATVDVDAVLDFAATFGTIAIARAYADWSTPVNASYRGQLIDRAVDLVQLFPLSATKNGADIRLAVDAVEDMFRIDDLTHIVIVAGDSDYVALAQKAKRLGRYVVGIGVAGGTSRALTAACDEYADYDTLLATDAAVTDDEAADAAASAAEPAAAPTTGRRTRAKAAAEPADATATDGATEPAADASTKAPTRRRRATTKSVADASATAPAETAEPAEAPEPPAKRASARALQFVAPTDHAPADDTAGGSPRNPSRLLLKALELLHAKNDEEWQSSSTVKNQMMRMDPSFQERRLGFASFTDFLKSRGGVVELDETGRGRVRIRPTKD
ncbi:NYN domain-containing protein [Agromyces cerinus]|uniref:TIGR00288 family protein n=1 Tax=Agromyces cerinus subsp. cerinus TaxID=232089 RepID=A0A1N6GGY0_9MICO|nr:NYN domain-containing protein [Agromyces cerinus]SIO06756.1 TIGR00288 family protein [Agromyces cerinus subsp. cerinus]